MDLENEKIGPAFKAPDSYFKETESRLLQRLGIQADVQEKVVDIQTGDIVQPTIQQVSVAAPLNTAGVQKRARKQDPMTAKSEGINKEVDALGAQPQVEGDIAVARGGLQVVIFRVALQSAASFGLPSGKASAKSEPRFTPPTLVTEATSSGATPAT